MSRYVDVDSDQAPLAFRLRLPEDDQAPSILMLHGLGGDETVMWALESALPQSGMIVAPRAPHEQRNGGYAWNPIIRAWPPLISEFSEAVTLLEELIDYLNAEYAFQRDQMLLMGFSNGAAMSFAATMTPLSQAPLGIIAIAGHLPEGDLSPLREIPVYWGHGIHDAFIPIDVAREDVRRLRDLGVTVTLCEADVGHKLGADCLRNLKSWLQTEFPSTEPKDIERNQ